MGWDGNGIRVKVGRSMFSIRVRIKNWQCGGHSCCCYQLHIYIYGDQIDFSESRWGRGVGFEGGKGEK